MDTHKYRDRTVLRVAAETELEGATSSSCLITSGEIVKTTNAADFFIYLGTSNGKIFLLSWKPPFDVSGLNLNLQSNSDSSRSSEEHGTKVFISRSISTEAVKSIVGLSESGRVAALAGEFVYLFDVNMVESIHKLSFSQGASSIAKRLISLGKNVAGIDFMKGQLLSDSKRVSEEPSKFLRKISGAGKITKKGLSHTETSSGHERGSGSRAQNAHLAVACGKKLLLCEILGCGDIDPKEVSWQKQSKLLMNDFGGASNARVKEVDGIEGVVTMSWLDNSVFVGTCNGYVLINVMDGNVMPIFSFPDALEAPLLKCLPRFGEVLLLLDNVGITVDTSGQPSAGSLLFKFHPQSVGCCESYVVVASNGQLELYHKETGSRVQLLSLETFGHSIVVDDYHGGFVAVATKSKVMLLQLVPVEEQLKELLRKKNYDEAVFVVEECIRKGGDDRAKERLAFVHAQAGFLLLFDLQFKEAVDHFLQSDVMQPSEIFPFIMADPNRWSALVPRNRYWGLHPPPRPLEEVIDNGVSALQRGAFLKKAGVETGNFPAGQSVLPSPSNRNTLLELAIENFIRYLKVSREKELAYQVKEGIDTLLMYLYKVRGFTEEMEELASHENFCVVEELESLLEGSGHLRTLALLYASKGLIAKSMGVWQTIAHKNLTVPLQKSSAVWKRGKLIYSLSERLVAAAEAANLLEESSDHKLVLDHLTWIIEMDHDLVVRVLISPKRSIPLPPDEVLSTIDPHAIDVHQRYLQWLIEDQGSEDPQLHTLYALLLAKEALDIHNGIVAQESGSQNIAGCSLNAEKEDSNDNGGMTDPALSDQNYNSIICKPTRERLQAFLLSSEKYDPEAVLDLIKESDLWAEQAILYRRLGEESAVLHILALKLEDCEAAESYCAELGRPDAYMQLLDMYLDPGDGKEPMYNAAVRLLHCHGQSLDPLQVLEALSSDMPLHLSSEIISRMLRARAHHLRQGQIARNLSRALNLDARLSRYEERSRHVQVTDETLCDSCHARLGTKLFAMYPNDSVVCYKCSRRSGGHVCPVTGQDFKKDPMFKPSWLVRMFDHD